MYIKGGKLKFKRLNRPCIKVKLRTYLLVRDFLISIVSWFDRYIFMIGTLLWCLLIFLFSNQIASESSIMSNNVYNNFNNFIFLRLLFDIIPIRKCAHMFLYFILSILCYFHMYRYTFKPYLFTMLFCYLYACTDEIHQLFIMGRSGSFIDTIIDFTGCLIGLIVIKLIELCIRKLAYTKL